VSSLLAALLLFAAWQSHEPITVDVGNTSGKIDTLYVEDFYAPETNPQASYRWAGPGSKVHFYGVGHADWQVVARIASARSPEQGPLSVALSEGRGLPPFATVDNVAQDFTDYTFQVPGSRFQAPAHGNVEVEIAVSSVITSTEDPRKKGVAVDRITLQPQGVVLPPATSFVALTLAVGAITLAVALMAGGFVSLATGVVLGLAFAWLIGWNRLWLTPFAGQIFLVALVVVAGVALIKAMLLKYAPAGAGYGALSAEGEGRREEADGIRLALVAMLACVFAFALAQFGYEMALLFGKPRAVDFQAMWQATKGASLGEPLYNLEGLAQNPFASYYKYPPTFAGLLRPLTVLDFDTARDVWRGLGVAFFVAGIAVIILTFTRRPVTTVQSSTARPELAEGFMVQEGSRSEPRRWYEWATPAALGLIFLALLFHPVIDALNYGQLDPLILLLVALSFGAMRLDRPVASGIALGIAAGLKIYPCALALYFLWRREWRALGAFGLTLVGWVLLGAVLNNPADSVTYYTQVLPASGGTTSWVENQTLSGFIARLLTDRISLEQFGADPQSGSLSLTLLNIAVGVVVVGITLWSARGDGARTGPVYALGFAALLTASIFLLPAAWLHYMVVMLLPLGIALYCLQAKGGEWWIREPRKLTIAVVLIGVGMVLLAFGNIWLFYNRENLGGIWKLILSYKFYGAVALWVGLILMLRIEAAGTSKGAARQEASTPDVVKEAHERSREQAR
jgi:hypothetical protein